MAWYNPFTWFNKALRALSAAGQAAYRRWRGILNTQYALFVADVMAGASTAIETMSKDGINRTGTEKRDYVVNMLIGTFTKHALVLAGRIAVDEVKQLIHLGIENELTAKLLARKNIPL